MTAVQPPFAGLIDSHLAAIVVYSTDAIIGLKLDGTITSWNPAAERMFAYTSEQALGQNVRLLVPLDLRLEHDELMARTTSGELIQGFETSRARKDGSSGSCEAAATAARATDTGCPDRLRAQGNRRNEHRLLL